jgi:hypothetical protein
MAKTFAWTILSIPAIPIAEPTNAYISMSTFPKPATSKSVQSGKTLFTSAIRRARRASKSFEV